MKRFDETIGTSLAQEHRKYLANDVNLHDYDVYVYHEDDIIWRAHHLYAFLSETKVLFKEEKAHTNGIGFLRYRRSFRGGDIHNPKAEEDAVLGSEFLEETPKFFPSCLGKTISNHPVISGYINNTINFHIFLQEKQCLWLLVILTKPCGH